MNDLEQIEAAMPTELDIQEYQVKSTLLEELLRFGERGRRRHQVATLLQKILQGETQAFFVINYQDMGGHVFSLLQRSHLTASF